MGEIFGVGCTHYPGLTVPDKRLPVGFHRLLTAPACRRITRIARIGRPNSWPNWARWRRCTAAQWFEITSEPTLHVREVLRFLSDVSRGGCA